MKNNLKICFSFVFLLTLVSGNLFAQNCIVSGQIIDSLTNEPVAFATARVTEKQSPKIVNAVAADEQGLFSLTINSTGDFLLIAEFVGKRSDSVYFSVSLNQKNIDLKKIMMTNQSTQLATVSVTAATPLVKTDIDRIIYDTQADPDSKSNTVLDMLRKVPMVTVDGEDKIQIKGGSNYKIYLNGKPSTMISNNPSQVLKSMPASSVKKIEVITDPGAKYDAEGVGAILNIVTESSFGGYSGSVNTSIDNLGSYGLGGYFSTKIGKFGITANFNHHSGRDNAINSYTTQENLNQDIVQNTYRFMRQDSRGERIEYNTDWGSLEASYEFDSLNLVSVSASGYSGNYKNSNTYSTILMYASSYDQTPISGYNTLADYAGIWGGFSINAHYQRNFHKKDRLLIFSYQFDHSPNSSENTVITGDSAGLANMFNPSPSDRKISMDGSTGEHTFQIDYTEPLGKKHVIETGVKYILRQNNSNNQYQKRDSLTNLYIPDITQTSPGNMRYRQNIFGAYGSYTFKLEKFNARAGLRLENTASEVKFIDQPNNNFTPKSYFNIVPSVVLSYKTSVASNLKLSYNQSISRPGIWYLNPFVDNADVTNISKGNPKLKAELTNSFGINYGFFNQKFNLNASLNTSFTNNLIDRMSILQNTDNKITVLTTYENIGKHYNTGGSLFFAWSPTVKFRISANTGLYHNYYNTEYYTAENLKQIFRNEGWMYYIFGGFSYTLPFDLKLGFDAAYQSPQVALQGKGFAWSYSMVGLSKDFFKKKLNVSIRMRGVFQNKIVFSNEFTQQGQYERYFHSEQNFRVVSLRLTYTFGQMKEQIKKVQRTISNDDLKSGGQGQNNIEQQK